MTQDHAITTAVIIEDEKSNLVTLTYLLERNFPSIQLLGSASTAKGGVELINKSMPQLVFLDISLPDGTGFDVLEKAIYKNYKVIFTTAFDSFALRAFEFSALHYILKPVTYEELKNAIERYYNLKTDILIEDKLNVYKQNIQNNFQKIIIPSIDGFSMIMLDDIIRLEADDAYTVFILKTKQKLVASKPLNSFEKILTDLPFTRIHNKHLINLKFVNRYLKGKGGYVIMENGDEIEVSVRRKADFLLAMKNYARAV